MAKGPPESVYVDESDANDTPSWGGSYVAISCGWSSEASTEGQLGYNHPYLSDRVRCGGVGIDSKEHKVNDASGHSASHHAIETTQIRN
jgi:kynurenine formamidase